MQLFRTKGKEGSSVEAANHSESRIGNKTRNSAENYSHFSFKLVLLASVLIVVLINSLQKQTKTPVEPILFPEAQVAPKVTPQAIKSTPLQGFRVVSVPSTLGDNTPKSKNGKTKNKAASKSQRQRPVILKTKNQTVPIYYINLNEAKNRRKYIENHLNGLNLSAIRVSAVSNSDNVTLGLVAPSNMVNPNDKEMACIASHMIAIHQAVNDRSLLAANSPYAIILEDDVSIEFPINWNELLYNAPEDFDVLQLTTSNPAEVKSMLQYYEQTVPRMVEAGIARNISNPYKTKHDFLWNLRLRASNAWSTQAYAIRKDNIRRLINIRVKRNANTGEYKVFLKNTPNQVSQCKELKSKTCRLLYPYRVVADVYLYDLLGTAYTLRLPLLNGAVGFNSSIQTAKTDVLHQVAFRNISETVRYVRQHSQELLPQGLLL